MTLNEFKAWLGGFEAAMGDEPTAEQWAKIKAKLAQIQDQPKIKAEGPLYRVDPLYSSLAAPTNLPGTSVRGT